MSGRAAAHDRGSTRHLLIRRPTVEDHRGLPLGLGDSGEAVRDLHRRLARADHEPDDLSGHFDETTERAVRTFQMTRGLRPDGICGPQTWSALVEAGYSLGDRLLYLRRPMMRGDDVTDLQRRVGALGFDAGRVDGIFGPDTASALGEFQLNAGLLDDRICGPSTVAALARLGDRTTSASVVAALREREALRGAAGPLVDQRVALGEMGGCAVLVDAIARRLHESGASVLDLHHPNLTIQARSANAFDAVVYLGIGLDIRPLVTASYFSVPGFESTGGRTLATILCRQLQLWRPIEATCAPMRLPILRETRMPAVWCDIGPPTAVVESTATVVSCLTTALSEWMGQPVDE